MPKASSTSKDGIPNCSAQPFPTIAPTGPTSAQHPPPPLPPPPPAKKHKLYSFPSKPYMRARASSSSATLTAAWNSSDDERLITLKASGKKWTEMSSIFPGKTSNACRKRHARLVTNKVLEWDEERERQLAVEFVGAKNGLWKVIGGVVGLEWQQVEKKGKKTGGLGSTPMRLLPPSTPTTTTSTTTAMPSPSSPNSPITTPPIPCVAAEKPDVAVTPAPKSGGISVPSEQPHLIGGAIPQGVIERGFSLERRDEDSDQPLANRKKRVMTNEDVRILDKGYVEDEEVRNGDDEMEGVIMEDIADGDQERLKVK